VAFLQDVSKYSKGILVYVNPAFVLNSEIGNSRLLLEPSLPNVNSEMQDGFPTGCFKIFERHTCLCESCLRAKLGKEHFTFVAGLS
jgi:hypothetical protein